MIKKITQGDYEIEIEDSDGMSNDQIRTLTLDVLSIVKRKEVKNKKTLDKEETSFQDLKRKIAEIYEIDPKEVDDEEVHMVWDLYKTYNKKIPLQQIIVYRKVLKEKEIQDIKIEDVPVNAPEENISITYNEKLKGGKNALTYGMIEEAFKQREKDGGKTFEAYAKVALDSLKEDVQNAKYIVSGERKEVRNLLLEDYVKVEHLLKKAGMTDLLSEFSPLVDKLSEELKLNYFKQPKFKKSEMKIRSKELRSKHRYDSNIQKSFKPVFLCSKTDLTASYNDAKQGKLPEVFEANLEKVKKDLFADYDRINQGRDNYLEDPRIVKVLPDIVDLYETATKYADDLGYSEIAEEFEFMLNTVKKGWGLE